MRHTEQARPTAPPEPRLLTVSEQPVDRVIPSSRFGSEDVAHDEVKAEARLYFSSLDRRTNYKLGLMDPAMVPPINAVWVTLFGRIRQRCRAQAEESSGEALPRHPAPVDVRAISQLMLTVIAEFFGEPNSLPEWVAKVGAAHDVFSWGGLFRRSTQRLVERSNTSPDGAAIFMFPEFAHLAVEMEIDADRWIALLPILTRMPALYVRAHELDDPKFRPKPFGDYGYPPESDGREPELYAHAQLLASMYHGLSRPLLADELDGLVAKAFTPNGFKLTRG